MNETDDILTSDKRLGMLVRVWEIMADAEGVSVEQYVRDLVWVDVVEYFEDPAHYEVLRVLLRKELANYPHPKRC